MSPLRRTVYAHSVSAVACGVIMPGLCALGFYAGRAASRLVSPIGVAIDATADLLLGDEEEA